MTQPLGPPAPPTAQETYNDMRRTVIHRIPASLNRTRKGILALRQIGRRR